MNTGRNKSHENLCEQLFRQDFLNLKQEIDRKKNIFFTIFVLKKFFFIFKNKRDIHFSNGIINFLCPFHVEKLAIILEIFLTAILMAVNIMTRKY